MRKLLKLKQLAALGFVSSVGSLAMAQDYSAGIKTAMEGIQTEATTNTGVMVPIAIGIMGVIIGALLVLGLMGKIGGKLR